MTYYSFRICGVFDRPDFTVEAESHAHAVVKSYAEMLSAPNKCGYDRTMSLDEYQRQFLVTLDAHHRVPRTARKPRSSRPTKSSTSVSTRLRQENSNLISNNAKLRSELYGIKSKLALLEGIMRDALVSKPAEPKTNKEEVIQSA